MADQAHGGAAVRDERAEPSWIRSLTADDALDDVVDRRLERSIDRGPIEWAVSSARANARRALQEFPELGAGEEQLRQMEDATEAVALALVQTLRDGATRSPDRESLAPLIADCVQRRVPLTYLERAMRLGHAWWTEQLLLACLAHTPHETQPAELAATSQLMFSFLDILVLDVANIFEEERERWGQSREAQRAKVVERLLQDPGAAPRDASVQLGYELERRWHRAVVLWHVEGTRSRRELASAGRDWLKAHGARHSLVIPHGPATVWAWGCSTTEPPNPADGPCPDVPDQVRIAVGRPQFGLPGFARSHEMAREAYELTERCPFLTGPTVAYDDVSLVALLLRSPAATDRFVADELGRLAGADPHVEELRRTVEVYLESHSPMATGERLFLSRNAVSHRIKQAEELLGRKVTDRPLELGTALAVCRVRGTVT